MVVHSEFEMHNVFPSTKGLQRERACNSHSDSVGGAIKKVLLKIVTPELGLLVYWGSILRI